MVKHKSNGQRYLTVALLTASFLWLAGCSTANKMIKHGKLETETKMSDTIFLDPIEDSKKTALVQVRNTSGKSGLNIKSQIRKALVSKGYRIVTNPKAANVMVQANILQVGKSTLDNPFYAMTGGYGSGLEGFAAGAALSGATGGSGRSMLGVGLLAGAGNALLDAVVEVVNYSMITDLQISEKASGNFVSESSSASLRQGTSGHKKSTWSQKTNWKRYQTRIVSVAKKVNLKFEDAEPKLTEELARSISGLL